MTVFTEISGIRARKLRIDLSPSSLGAVDDFLCQFADGHNWTEEGKNRLRLVGEEVMLNLFNDETDASLEQKRRLVATIRPDGGSAELKSWSRRTMPSRGISRTAWPIWARTRRWKTNRNCPSESCVTSPHRYTIANTTA